MCGGTVDLNETYAVDFGQWPRPSSPIPVPQTKDDDMPYLIRNGGGNGAVFLIGAGAPSHVPSQERYGALGAIFPTVNYSVPGDFEAHLAAVNEEWSDKKASVLYLAGTYNETVETGDNVADIEELLKLPAPE
jgi:hypothetical protein